MAKAIIMLDDTGAGQFVANIEYVGGFSDQSDAQKYGYLLMCQLNKLATPEGAEQVMGNAPSARTDLASETPA